jgi:GNAT superfamily N-acetyltransferase
MQTPQPADAPCQHLPWDTKFFGLETARVTGNTLTPASAGEIDQWCQARKIRLLYFLAQSDDPLTARTAQEAGYRPVDLRTTFERSLTDHLPAPHAAIGPFVPSDLTALQRIARTSYTDSRFYHDGHIPRATCDRLYEIWTMQSCQGESGGQVLVAREAGGAIGYVTCDLDPTTHQAAIGLIGVDPFFRKKGIGRQLVESALAWGARQGGLGMTVVTQGRNIAARHLYQRSGFVTRLIQQYYHKWYA